MEESARGAWRNKMNDFLKGMIIFIMGLLLVITLISGAVYYYHQLEIDNFQVTIKDLSDEQKCIHICGFQFGNILESYKFCMEKCDRISERLGERKFTHKDLEIAYKEGRAEVLERLVEQLLKIELKERVRFL